MSPSSLLSICLWCSAGLGQETAPPPPGVETPLLVEAGRVITISGEELENASVLIEEGRITAVGKGVTSRWNARVLKFPRSTVIAGLVSAHGTQGLRVPNENVPNAAYISVLDGLDPSSAALKNALRDGVTTMHVIPANATRFGGQGAVIRTAGRTIEELVIRAPSALKVSLRPPPGETRMQTMAALRKSFLDLYLEAREVAAAPSAGLAPARPGKEPTLTEIVESRPPWKDLAWDAVELDRLSTELRPLASVVRGELPVFLYCPGASDVFKAFELIDAQGLKATLVLGPDAHKAAQVLRARKDLGPVVLDPELSTWETDPETGAEERRSAARSLFDAGVPFAVVPAADGRDQGPGLSRDPDLHLWYQAALLVQLGIPRAEALRAVTLTPARILGISHRIGSLEVGKDGNLAIFSGDPLDARSWVEAVVIEGRLVYRWEQDRDLDLLRNEPERSF